MYSESEKWKSKHPVTAGEAGVQLNETLQRPRGLAIHSGTPGARVDISCINQGPVPGNTPHAVAADSPCLGPLHLCLPGKHILAFLGSLATSCSLPTILFSWVIFLDATADVDMT